MLFNSYAFILVFLPLVVSGYFFLTNRRCLTAARGWLVVASLFFYAWWNVHFLPVILVSMAFNFLVGQSLLSDWSTKCVWRKRVFQLGLIVNIAALVYFKYTDFAILQLNQWLGWQCALPHIVLPLGISFFTITQITYLVDCYEGLVEKTPLLDYLLFVTFFPHLLMGPILHHKQMMPQFTNLRAKLWQPRLALQGMVLFIIGLAKKVLLADTFAVWARQGFDALPVLSLADAWVSVLSYTFQLYFDFSGYSDMALGAALLFNIRLPLNFNTPLRADNIIDFWQRWHISLTQFITTYLYTPVLLACKRIQFRHMALATFVSMFVAGLWHEAGWGFLLFYVLHSLALIANHWWKRKKKKMPSAPAWLLTFLFVNLTLAITRTHDWATLEKIFRGLAGVTTAPNQMADASLALLLGGGLWLAVCGRNSQEWATDLRPSWLTFGGLVVLFMAALLRLNQVSEFLYFNF